jgi:glycosyltransferase involved in cell wall biosynthesis
MHTDLKDIRVAVVHDWLNGMRGGEQVLDSILELFPQAELFTLFYSPGKLNARIEGHPIHTSFLNRLPWVEKYYRFLLPFFPLAIESFDLNRFDLIISSSHCVAKGVIPPPDSLHICYSHTPIRYAWDSFRDYFSKSFLLPLISPVLHYLRIWDSTSSSRVDYFVANSKWVQNRIMKYYRRDSFIVNPFFNPQHFQPLKGERGNFYLIVSAFAPYKRIDLAIKACEKLKRQLVIIGTGQEEKHLKSISGAQTQFLGKTSLETLKEMYSSARALIFPGVEDFGITPLESMASGTPVIAFQRGGATETVVPNQTGVFFDEQTVESLCEAILRFELMPQTWNDACVSQARLFTRDRFQQNFSDFVKAAWSSHQRLKPQRNLELSRLD